MFNRFSNRSNQGQYQSGNYTGAPPVNRYWGLKFAALGVFLLLVMLISYLVKNYIGNKKEPNIEVVSGPSKGLKKRENKLTTDTLADLRTKDGDNDVSDKIRDDVDEQFVDNSKVKKNNTPSISIRANSLDELRQKIKAESNSIMKNKEYIPENCKINVRKFTFSCDLKKQSSNYTKISFVWGPALNGTNECESGINVLSKNPGSNTELTKVSNNMVYKVISIAE